MQDERFHSATAEDYNEDNDSDRIMTRIMMRIMLSMGIRISTSKRIRIWVRIMIRPRPRLSIGISMMMRVGGWRDALKCFIVLSVANLLIVKFKDVSTTLCGLNRCGVKDHALVRCCGRGPHQPLLW